MSLARRIATHLRAHEVRLLDDATIRSCESEQRRGPDSHTLPHVLFQAKLGFQALVGSRGASSQSKELMDAEIEHATGLERKQLESERKGVDLFHEPWLDAPFGTETNPVEVTSAFAERVVGVPDAEDDSTIWWGTLKAGEPPKQITQNGEYFVLKQE